MSPLVFVALLTYWDSFGPFVGRESMPTSANNQWLFVDTEMLENSSTVDDYKTQIYMSTWYLRQGLSKLRRQLWPLKLQTQKRSRGGIFRTMIVLEAGSGCENSSMNWTLYTLTGRVNHVQRGDRQSRLCVLESPCQPQLNTRQLYVKRDVMASTSLVGELCIRDTQRQPQIQRGM